MKIFVTYVEKQEKVRRNNGGKQKQIRTDRARNANLTKEPQDQAVVLKAYLRSAIRFSIHVNFKPKING
jgi:hypothetical protein